MNMQLGNKQYERPNANFLKSFFFLLFYMKKSNVILGYFQLHSTHDPHVTALLTEGSFLSLSQAGFVPSLTGWLHPHRLVLPCASVINHDLSVGKLQVLSADI